MGFTIFTPLPARYRRRLFPYSSQSFFFYIFLLHFSVSRSNFSARGHETRIDARTDIPRGRKSIKKTCFESAFDYTTQHFGPRTQKTPAAVGYKIYCMPRPKSTIKMISLNDLYLSHSLFLPIRPSRLEDKSLHCEIFYFHYFFSLISSFRF